MEQDQLPSIKKPQEFYTKQSSLYFSDYDKEPIINNSKSLSSTQLSQQEPQQPKQNKQLEDIPENVLQVKMGIKPKYVYSLEDNLNLSIRLRYKKVQMRKDKRQIIPGMISISAKDFDQEKLRNGMIIDQPIDLIFVIDTSGSMSGDKIEMVKKTLLQIIDFMKKEDRIAIIEFNNRASVHLNFTSVSKENLSIIQNVTSNLHASGGTDIGEGMNQAFQLIKNRDFKNQVTSIFLLTDGQDERGLNRTQYYLREANIQDNFSIDCFGYGSDHDYKLMYQISNIKQGTFNFISDISKIDLAFAIVFAGIKSVVAQNIQIAIKFGNTSIMNGLKVRKTYGDQWIKCETDNGYAIKLQQLLAGLSKEFVFELEIPPFEMKLPDQMRFQTVTVAQVKADCLNTQQQCKKIASCTLELLNCDMLNQQIEEDGEVMENYFRVAAGEAMILGQQEANKGNHEKGNQALQVVIENINRTKYRNNTNMVDLLSDLKNCQIACQKLNYNNFGEGYLLNAQQQNMNQNTQMNCAPIFSNLSRIKNQCNHQQVVFQKRIKHRKN